MNRGPRPRAVAAADVARCVVVSLGMLARREIHQPRANLGRVIRFGDGSTGRVYRETVADRTALEPCFLVVSFRLRWVRGRGHTLFRLESLLNTPLFIGFPGFVSKLWLAHDDRGVYRGLYEWDGAERAERYARSLWRVLELVSEPGSISYRVFPGLHRDEALAQPASLDPYVAVGEEAGQGQWWRVVAAS